MPIQNTKILPITSIPPAPHPWIALVDMNSYFATLEQQRHPELRGLPVGVLKDAGRSCIIAASKEAKKYGVRTGMRLSDARRLCPHIRTVPAHFNDYFTKTKILKKLFESLTPDVYVFSLDEAFISLTGCQHLYPDCADFFRRVRVAVQAALGEWVTFSIGFGANRLQAKLASEFAGNDNWFAITADNLNACLAESKVEEVCGIGFRLGARLNMLGITHIYQLNFVDDEFLHEHFGPFWGPALRRIGRGENSPTLNFIEYERAHMKSVGRSKILYKSTTDRDHLEQLMYNLTEDMCYKARQMDLAGRMIAVSCRNTDQEWFGRHQRLEYVVHHTTEVFALLQKLFRSLQYGKLPIIKMSVHLSDLQPLAETPLCWLPSWNQNTKAYQAIDRINHKYGAFTLKPARLMNFRLAMPEVTGFLGDRQYQFGEYNQLEYA